MWSCCELTGSHAITVGGCVPKLASCKAITECRGVSKLMRCHAVTECRGVTELVRRKAIATIDAVAELRAVLREAWRREDHITSAISVRMVPSPKGEKP